MILSASPRVCRAATVAAAGIVCASFSFLILAPVRAAKPKPAPAKKVGKAAAKPGTKTVAKASLQLALPGKRVVLSGTVKTITAKPTLASRGSLASRGTAFKVAAPVPLAKINPAYLLGTGGESAMVEVVAAGKGRINYEANIVKAVGLGALPPPTLAHSRAQDALDARHAALADALRTLGMAVSQVRVSSDSRVQNYVLQSDEIRLRVRALVQSAQVVEEKYVPAAGIFRVVVQMNLTGPDSLSEAVGVGGSGKKTLLASEKVPAPVPVAAPDPFAPGSFAPSSARYTSLIVDCRGLEVRACMSPRVFQKCGDEVYGTMHVSPDYVIETGIAAFPRSMNDALNTNRTGDRPLVVRAKYVKDENRFYPVISDQDAEKIRDANRDSHFFERTAVILVLDPVR